MNPDQHRTARILNLPPESWVPDHLHHLRWSEDPLTLVIDTNGDVRWAVHGSGGNLVTRAAVLKGKGTRRNVLAFLHHVARNERADLTLLRDHLHRLCIAHDVNTAFASIPTAPFVDSATPWGAVTTSRVVDDGVVHVTTPGHHGYWLDHVALRRLPPVARREGGWYEGDEEGALLAVAFGWPHAQDAARRRLGRRDPQGLAALLDCPHLRRFREARPHPSDTTP